jgi:hypothetical protein
MPSFAPPAILPAGHAKEVEGVRCGRVPNGPAGYAAAEYLMVLQEAVKARLNRQARRARQEEEPFQPLDEERATKEKE